MPGCGLGVAWEQIGVEVALHRGVVFIDGRVAAGTGDRCAVTEEEIADLTRAVFRDAGYGAAFPPDSDALDVRFDLCLGPLEPEERAARDVSDDQSIAVGYACGGARAGYRPLERALATDFVRAIEQLRREHPELGLGPDGKSLVVVRGTRLVGVSLSVQHAPGAEWLSLTETVRQAEWAGCADGKAPPPGHDEWPEMGPRTMGGRLRVERRAR